MSYGLEYCNTTNHQVVENYVKTRKLQYLISEFPGEKIHSHALRAAEAARCANAQGKFRDLHDQLFSHQRDLGATGIKDAAHAAGLNEPQFSACLAAGKYAEGVRHTEEAKSKLGIPRTPVFVVGGGNPGKIKVGRALVGTQPFAVFQQPIDSLLAK
jgi:protein-disulfide isomerase